MPPRDLQDLCRRIVPGAGDLTIDRLGVGLLSETYRVARQGVLYTLKIAVQPRSELDLDWGWETRLLERAAAAALAPRVVHVDQKGQVLLTEWILGRPWSSADAANSANIGRFAALLQRVHSLQIPLPARHITPRRWIEIYSQAMSRRGLPLPEATLRTAAAARLEELSGLGVVPSTVCHSDLHALNLLEQNGELVLLDWEYAHATDPFWDLAGWSANNDWDAALQARLLEDYTGEPPRDPDWRRLRLYCWLYDYVCLLWSRLYLSGTGQGAPGGSDGIAQRARFLGERLRLAAH